MTPPVSRASEPCSRRSVLLSLAAALATPLIWSCSKLGGEKCTTDKTLTAAQLRALFPNRNVLCGDTSYSEVNPAFATSWHDWMGKVMSLLGSPAKWNERLDCNRFVSVKLAVIQVRYLVDTWHSWVAGQAPAAGEAWYTAMGTGGLRGAHATIVTVEGGQVVYRDVYTANVLNLTGAEKASVTLVKF